VPDVEPDVEKERRRRQEAADAHLWFHSLDLGYDVVTRGIKNPDVLQGELDRMQLPDLHGKTVLDIGAWDGYFSFAAEQRGAARVVALDYHSWSVDLPRAQEYVNGHIAAGTAPRSYELVPEIWDPVTLPGRRGFDSARELRDSQVDAVVGDFMKVSLDDLGRFDVVLFLGVLYHLEDPYLSLRRLAEVTNDIALIETACVVVPGREHHALWEFFETSELNNDQTNWWAPNQKALVGACRAAGFSRVEVLAAPPPDAPVAEYEWHYGRALVKAYK
jgi:tRNA (mo5U34)-methyltransferase